MPIYMNYNDLAIKGDCTEEGHKEWVVVSSAQFGVGRGISSPTGTTANREASAPSVSEITITKLLDNGSTKVLDAALQGEGVKCVIEFTKTDKGKLETYLTWTLSETMISGYSLSSGGDRPSESVSLNFTKIEFKNVPNKTDGSPGDPDTITYDVGKAVVS